MALGFRRLSLIPHDPVRTAKPAFYVITEEAQLEELYGGATLRPRVSFSKYVIVVVHRGFCPTGGYRITIDEITLKGRDLLVRVHTENPGPEDFVTLVSTYPSDAVALPKAALDGPGPYRAIINSRGTEVAVVPFVI